VRLAGLTALARTDGDAPGPLRIRGRAPDVSDYLASEWLRDLTDDERDVLTRVSPLDRLSGPLCNEVLGRDDAGEVLHRVFRDRLLLIPLDHHDGAYRMHGLLRDALEAAFERADPQGLRLVHARASTWFERAGDPDRAIRHAVAAGDVERAGDLVVDHTPAFYTNGRFTTVQRWIELLPREQVVASAALCLCAALAELGLGHPEALSVWIRLGEHAADAAPEGDGTARLCLLDLRSTTNTGPVRAALEDAAAAYRGLPPSIWHAASCLAYGVWSWTVGDDAATQILTEGADEAAVLGAPALEAYCTAMLALIAHADHDPTRAWALVARARRVAVEHGLERAPGMAIVSAMHALEAASTGDPETARRDWQLARTQLAVLKDLSGWANVQIRVALAHASLLLGDRVGAETMLREARDFLVRQPDATPLAAT
jgi:LuxR family maltose regulon positive regulatory protein